MLFTSCSVNEKAIPGHYEAADSSQVQLIINKNKTYDFEISNANNSHLGIPDFQGTGIWQLDKNRLKLLQPKSPFIDDSITRFTSISCFNFWDNNGDPVPIRYIIVPPAKPKPHFGNSLYYFAQDFKTTDTLTFYFDGYPPFKFPGSVPPSIGNNIHKITMQEPNRNQSNGIQFIVRKKALLLLPKKQRYSKKH